MHSIKCAFEINEADVERFVVLFCEVECCACEEEAVSGTSVGSKAKLGCEVVEKWGEADFGVYDHAE